MTTISAKAVLVSQHAQTGKRIATLLLRYPRCIHAEFMTHRMLSRNSASSRAIPVSKLIKDVIDDPFVPLHWGKNQKGMQAHEECDDAVQDVLLAQHGETGSVDRLNAWIAARDQAVQHALAFSNAGYHKQIVNRLIEPFAHITVVATGTEWANFLALRDHKDAEPHIQMLAREVRTALDEAEVQILQTGEWHLPFVTENDKDAICFDQGCGPDYTPAFIDRAIKLSVARCASTSYKTVDGFDMTLERAIDLHDKLLAAEPLHASPAEHQAQADEFLPCGDYSGGFWRHEHEWGNLRHFRQYRKMLPNEWVPG